MTYEEALKQTVKFSSYYKYSFSFRNDDGLYVSVGGSSDDIYRFDVEADKEYTVEALEPSYISYNGEQIKIPNVW